MHASCAVPARQMITSGSMHNCACFCCRQDWAIEAAAWTESKRLHSCKDTALPLPAGYGLGGAAVISQMWGCQGWLRLSQAKASALVEGSRVMPCHSTAAACMLIVIGRLCFAARQKAVLLSCALQRDAALAQRHGASGEMARSPLVLLSLGLCCRSW